MTNNARMRSVYMFFLFGMPVLAAILVPLAVVKGVGTFAAFATCIALYFLIGMSVTAGYHRAFSHRSATVTAPVRAILLFFGAAAFQNSALKWCSDHRLHHRFTDTDDDPYSVRKGFWWAHWLWVIWGNDPQMTGVDDLEADPLIRFQHRFYVPLSILAGVVLPTLIGFLVGNPFGFFAIAVVLRIVITHQSTFLINSAAHWFGSRPYDREASARDNGILAIFTFGEGYHNFHHTWAADYRNGHRWWQIDPTKWLLFALSRVGLVHSLRRTPEAVVRRARLAADHATLAERLNHEAHAPVRERFSAAHARLDAAIAAAHAHAAEWERRNRESRAAAKEARDASWKAFREARDRHKEELRRHFEEWRAARRAARLALATAAA